jgi:hypothetical protein
MIVGIDLRMYALHSLRLVRTTVHTGALFRQSSSQMPELPPAELAAVPCRISYSAATAIFEFLRNKIKTVSPKAIHKI